MTKARELADFARGLPDRFSSGSAFEAWAADNPSIPDGSIVTVGGLQYISSAGATALSDRGLPGWLPFGPLFSGHFGIVANLTFTDHGTGGPERTAGTNQLAAFRAADAYSVATGRTIMVSPGGYFIEQPSDDYMTEGFIPQGKWQSEQDMGAIIWVKHPALTTAIWIRSPDVHWIGFRMVGQYNSSGKPSGAGHLGNIATVGKYLETGPQVPLPGVKVRVRARRARNTAEEPSLGAFFFNGIGAALGVQWQIGVWGEGTNAGASTGFIQHHWGGQIDGPVRRDGGAIAWNLGLDPTDYSYLDDSVWHPEGCTIEFLDPEIDCVAHKILQGHVRSANITVHVGQACNFVGAQRPVYVLPGDEVNLKTNPVQRYKVGWGNTMGAQHHTGATPRGIGQSWQSALASDAMLVAGVGTSRDTFTAGYSWVNTGTTAAPVWEWTLGVIPDKFHSDTYQSGDGVYLEMMTEGYTDVMQAVRYFGIGPKSYIRPGPLNIVVNHPPPPAAGTNNAWALYWQGGIGNGEIVVQSSNRPVRVRQGWFEKMDIAPDLGETKVVLPTGIAQRGWDSAGCVLSVESSEVILTGARTSPSGGTPVTVPSLPMFLGADVARGDEMLTVSPFLGINLHAGAVVRVNDDGVLKEFVVREYSALNAAQVKIQRSMHAIASSADKNISCILRAGLGRLVCRGKSSEFGIVMNGGVIESADISQMTGQGRYAVLMESHVAGLRTTEEVDSDLNSYLRVHDCRLPVDIGRLRLMESSVDACYTFFMRAGSRLVLDNVEMPDHLGIKSHILAQRTQTNGADGFRRTPKISLRDCRIENMSKLLQCTVAANSPIEHYIDMQGCTNFLGQPVGVGDIVQPA